MSIRDDLIQDVRKGMMVTITKADGTSVTGKAVKLDRSSIKIKTSTSILNILLAAVESYELPIEGNEKFFEDDEAGEDAVNVETEVNAEDETERGPEYFVAQINYCISMLTADAKLYAPTLEGLKNSDYDDEMLPRNKMLGIISLWERAFSEIDSAKRKKKCDAVMQGVAKLYEEKGHFVSAELLARMYFESEDYSEAAKWFARCGNSAALYVSLYKAGSMERYTHTKEYIINSRKLDPVLLLDILDRYKKGSSKKEFYDIVKIMEFDETSPKLQLIFCGLLYMADADKRYIEWANTSDLYTENNFRLLVAMLNKGDVIPVKHDETGEVVYKGVILNYDRERRYGFISDSPSNTFFRIEQVIDEKLMDMLMNKKFKPNYYRVSYVNARNAKGRRVADRITLLKRPEPIKKSGYIASYIRKYGLGYIKDGDKSYSFKLDMVIDPFLKVYLEHKQPENTKVTFYLDVLGTKDIACYVAMEKIFSDQEAMYLLEKNVLSQDDLIKWNNYKKYGPFYEEEPADEDEKMPLVDYVELEKL